MGLGTNKVLPPEPKSSQKCIGIATGTAMRRKLFQFLYIPAAENYFVGFERGDQEFYHIRNVTPPLFLAMLLQSSKPDVILVSCLFVGQVSQFHRLNDATNNQG